MNRREVLASLGRGVGLVIGSHLGCGRVGPSSTETPHSTPGSVPARRPSAAVSLKGLQEELRRTGSDPPDGLVLNRIHGFLVEPDDDVVLLGDVDPGVDPLPLDDLVVALRHAFGRPPTDPNTSPGCTIDPMIEADDPWKLQKVTVRGLPAVPMAARFVDLDYELKRVAGGLRSLGESVPSVYELRRASLFVCSNSTDDTRQAVTHRFLVLPAPGVRPPLRG